MQPDGATGLAGQQIGSEGMQIAAGMASEAPALKYDIASKESGTATARIFAHATFFSTMILQKFGFMSDRATLFISLPLFLIILAVMLGTRRAQFRSGVVMLYLGFICAIFLSTALALGFPDPRVGIGLFSPAAMILNYSIFLIKPTKNFDRQEVIRVFLLYVRFCAVVGISQYLLQFVGFRLFSFMMSFPVLTPILVEKTWNFYPVIAYGSSVVRANGLFLLEQSIFSQFLVMAIALEFFVLKKLKFLPLYGLAYLFSFSGTGILSLIFSIPFYAIFFFRESKRLLYLAIAILVIGVPIMLISPGLVAPLTNRADEFQSTGSSAHARYFAQMDGVNAIIGEPRAITGFGPGATDRAIFVANGSIGLVLKLIVDYGIIGLCIFMAFILLATLNVSLSIVPIVFLMIFTVGGGYMAFSPFLVTWAAVCIWGGGRPPEDGHAP
jgi:hypothetical protein